MSVSEAVNMQRTPATLFALNRSAQAWRNNVGAMQDDHGRVIRFGLANDSAKLNREIKSSDYIGVVPTLIEPWMIGAYLGVFAALEVKSSDWTFRPSDDRAVAQDRYHQLVRAACGFAGFVTDPERDIPRIIRPWA